MRWGCQGPKGYSDGLLHWVRTLLHKNLRPLGYWLPLRHRQLQARIYFVDIMSHLVHPASHPTYQRTLELPKPCSPQEWLARHNGSLYYASHLQKNDDQPLDFSKKASTTFQISDLSTNSRRYSLALEHELKKSSSPPPRSPPLEPLKVELNRDYYHHHRRALSPLEVEVTSQKAATDVFTPDHNQTPMSSPPDKDGDLPSSDEYYPSNLKPGFYSGNHTLTLMNPAALDPRMFQSRPELMPINPTAMFRNGFLNGNGILRTALQPVVPEPLSSDVDKNSKQTRPFKTYNPLPAPFPSGMPILPMGVAEDLEEQEYRYQQYIKQYYATNSAKTESSPPNPTSDTTPFNGNSINNRENPSASGTPDSTPQQQQPNNDVSSDSNHDSLSDLRQAADISSQRIHNRGGKRGRSLPEELKDAAYWERRKKNNEAAKRSRDSRRQKEDFIAMRASFLEDENKNLRLTIALLKHKLSSIKCCAAHSHNRY